MQDILLDLGSGTGRVVLAAALACPFLCLGSDRRGEWLYHPKMACFSMRNNGEKTDFSYVFWRLYHLTWIVSPGKMGKHVAHLCIFVLELKLYMNGFGLFNQEKCWYNGDVAKNIVTWGKTIDGWKHIWCRAFCWHCWSNLGVFEENH